MIIRQYSQWCINAHGRCGLGTTFCHRKHDGFYGLIRITKGFLDPVQVISGITRYTHIRDFHIFQLYQILIQPLSIRAFACIGLFQFVIIDDTTFDRINQKHFARTQTIFCHNFSRVYIQYANLRCKDQIIVICDVITGWTQTVTVKNGSHDITIAEHDRCRAIPRFHHSCIILIEVFFLLTHQVVVCPRLRNSDHNCQWKLHTTHNKELQCIIQHCGIGTGFIDYRKHLG